MKKFIGLLLFSSLCASPVTLGVDVFLQKRDLLKGKKVALAINQTSVNGKRKDTLSCFLKNDIEVVALFSPEHGLNGRGYAGEKIEDSNLRGIPIYSLHGKTRRPSSEMLQGIDIIVYDIQCTGVRAYTYPTMLFYIMEEAAKMGIQVIILDRPNPINGITVDGPMLDEKWRSYIGYINVPYCHGMTIGELASFFNREYKVGCKLEVIPMQGWKREMSYRDTGLTWIPPSPNIPEADTPLFSSMTGLLGELKIANIGIGYTLPFKVVGAPWIDAEKFTAKLNAQNLDGVHFNPYYFRPFYGAYKGENCQGALIQITNPKQLRPLAVQYLILGLLKSMYPKEFVNRITSSKNSIDLFCKANGSEVIYDTLIKDPYPAWKLIEFQKKEREQFLETRKKYLIY